MVSNPSRTSRAVGGLIVVFVAASCSQKPAPDPSAERAAVPVATPEATSTQVIAQPTSEPSPAAAVSAGTPSDHAGTKAVVVAPSGSARVDGAKETKETKGNDASSASFAAWLQAPSAKAGKPSVATAVLTAKPPYKCNDKYPHKLTLDPPSPGVSYPESVVRGMVVTPERSTLSVPFTAANPGRITISGTLSFSVCTQERCVTEKQPISVALDVGK